MNCSTFIEDYSDFRDGSLPPEDEGRMRAHLETCSSCARYDEVVDRGAELLRTLGGPEPRDDFSDRLRHRIYQTDLEMSRRRRGPSGTGPLTVAFTATALLVGAAVWGPLTDRSVVPESGLLPSVTASAPASAAAAASSESVTGGMERLLPSPDLVRAGTSSPRESATGAAFLSDVDLWGGASVLLWEHSSLYHRSRSGRMIQTGLH